MSMVDYTRANSAAYRVPALLLACALDHIAKTAAASHTQSRRTRWIQRRAELALEGREFDRADYQLPRDAGPNTADRMRVKVARYRFTALGLLASVQGLLTWADELDAEAKADGYSGGSVTAKTIREKCAGMAADAVAELTPQKAATASESTTTTTA